MTWGSILTHWLHLECDFHDVYGVDLDGDALDVRTWRWFRVRVAGLLSAETRLQRALSPPPTPTK